MAKKTELKTKKNAGSVTSFLSSIDDERKRKDAKTLLKIFKEATGEKPVMWGSSIVGFGEYSYTRSDKKTFNWMLTAFSPRKANLTVYIMSGYGSDKYKKLLEKLGPHKLGKACLYMRKLDDIHLPTLKKLITEDYKHMKKKYGKS